jgi:tRNA wybutosine-synthesizing protein 2
VYVLVVPKKLGELVKERIIAEGLLDKSKTIVQTGDAIEFPLTRGIEEDEIAVFFAEGDVSGIQCRRIEEDRGRLRFLDPIENIIKALKGRDFPQEKMGLIPRKWELIGDVLVLRFPPGLDDVKHDLANIYGEELGAKSVLEEYDKVQGELRLPQMRLLQGDNTETVHKENGILYELDAANILFSSGNVDERIRMGGLGPLPEEIVVDMFCGIGYFTLPIAVNSKPKMVYGCEKNRASFEYLKKNIERNGVKDRVTPLLGDNREVAPLGIADRVVMGYVGNTHEFLSKALEALRPEGGVIHYHETCPNELLPDRPVERLIKACEEKGRTLHSYTSRKIKSYAPGITHVVVDANII